MSKLKFISKKKLKSIKKEIDGLKNEIKEPQQKLYNIENTPSFKPNRESKETSLSDKWRNSVQLKGNYTFDEAQNAAPAGYRVPTHEEFQELVDNTEYSFDEETEECVFKFKDGYELRIPVGNYWSSTENSSTGAWFWGFHSSYRYAFNINKTYGFYVRCVRK